MYSKIRAIFSFLVLAVFLQNVLPAQELEKPEEAAYRPKIALVLSGGAALGFAHVGFLKVLEEVGIPVDIVIGNSMGSLVGALYAAGYSPGDIEAAAARINWAQIFLNEGPDQTKNHLEEQRPIYALNFDHTGIGTKRGILPDQNIILLLSRLVYRVSMHEDFAGLPLPYKTFAVDIAQGTGVPLDRGILYRAMRASMSIPLLFPPVPLNETLMVDGGLLNNNPIDLALEWGADIIIDVDVGSFAFRDPVEINGIGVVADQTVRLIMSTSIMSILASGKEDYRADMDMAGFSWMDFAKTQAIIDRGEAIARSTGSMKALLDLAAKIEESRPLEKRDWRRTGMYDSLDKPVFTKVRLELIGADSRPVDEKTVRAQFSQKYLDSLFGSFFDQPVDFQKLEAAVELLRRRGELESLGYHLEMKDGEYTLALTGVCALRRNNTFSFAADLDFLLGAHSRIVMTGYLDFMSRDLLLPGTLFHAGFSYKFSDIQGPEFYFGYSWDPLPLFSLRLGAEGAYYASTFSAFKPEGELSTFGFVSPGIEAVFKPVDFLELSASYRYTPLWYENKETGLSYSYSGDLHTAGLGINFNTLNITRRLLFAFLHNMDWRFFIEFPFAGSRLYGGNTFPWYERFEFSAQKVWTPHAWRNFIFGVNLASYRGELESRWTLYSPSGKANIPGYSGKEIPERNKFLMGFTYLEEITPLSNKIGMRSFFALTVRGGSLWQNIDSFDEFRRWQGGARAGLQIETPIGRIFAGPECSFDGKLQFCLYYN